jgi:glycosyltransferase involved in cell wall biosynthesis
MAKKKQRKARVGGPRSDAPRVNADARDLVQRASESAVKGEHAEAVRLLTEAEHATKEQAVLALARNSHGVLAAMKGDLAAAEQQFRSALEIDADCALASDNLALLQKDRAAVSVTGSRPAGAHSQEETVAMRPTRVAILSFLFNWPTTGGGNVHTAELALFLNRAGYDVRHYYARYSPWGIGRVHDTPYPSHALAFEESDWNLANVKAVFRRAVDAYAPDHVIITDSWNIKPHLADAVRGYSYFLRFQAMECLCPLNNVRLLLEPDGRAKQCPLHQLATPAECHGCLRERGRFSGSLHQAERELSEVGRQAYHELLLRSFREAEAVLVVNPLTEAMVSPYARNVRVVTAGMDAERFPAPTVAGPSAVAGRERKVILFAGLVDEWMKGYPVLYEACARLWRTRQDFELVATAEPTGPADEFTRFVGWQSQEELPVHIASCDILVIPTLAQEALGRTAVEAMAAGKPVIASRVGGLPSTVADGATGLLCEPGDTADLASKIAVLLDDTELRKRLGTAGRRRFEECYAWDVIVERHYRPLFGPVWREGAPQGEFAPVIPLRVSQTKLAEEIAEFFNLAPADIDERLRTYRAFHEAKGYAQTLGERKTLCFEEAFFLSVLLATYRPPTVICLGVGDGSSLRRLLDMKELLGIEFKAVCFDAIDQLQFCTLEEANLVVGDLQGRFTSAVLGAHAPGLIFVDVHTYPLLSEILAQTLTRSGDWVLAIHDCGRGLCNPRMTVLRNDPNVSSGTGIWERHVLAETFGISSPLSGDLDRAATASHQLRIFTTPHGLGVIRRLTRGGEEPAGGNSEPQETARPIAPVVVADASRPLRVLLLAHVGFFRDRMGKGLYYRYRALARRPGVILFGPGVVGYSADMTIEDAVRVACNGVWPDAIIHGCDPRASGRPIVTGLNRVRLVKAIEIYDAWAFEQEQFEFIRQLRFTIGLMAPDGEYIDRYRMACPETSFVWAPNAVDTEIFRDYGLEKDTDIILYGALNPEFYPFRARLAAILNRQREFRFRHIPHPGYYPPAGAEDTVISGERLSRRINGCWIGIATSSIYRCLLEKYLEISASCALVAGDMPDSARGAFGDDYVDLQPVDSDDTIIAKLRWALADKDRLRARIDAARFRVSKSYSTDAFAERVLGTLSKTVNLQQGSH